MSAPLSPPAVLLKAARVRSSGNRYCYYAIEYRKGRHTVDFRRHAIGPVWRFKTRSERDAWVARAPRYPREALKTTAYRYECDHAKDYAYADLEWR